ncbi:hypothetical protein GCM10008927_12150 [Amylibacter ulvae]|uniref:Sulfotransferase family protein n=1 Tax=Paramylibacter ulvae TaxID=1651968 RepID=A0ABQ3D2W9_9RHOB|nr:hypothetical protein [Amylibacter ulvae]GHA48614.1 hypothetical protein GCM10008927_12150 [Amylibacter ulvae]
MNTTDQIEVSFFLGAHRVALHYLNRCMLQNAEILASENIVVPTAKAGAGAVSQMIVNTNKGQSLSEAREEFFQRLMGDVENPKRLVVMTNSIAGSIRTPIVNTQAYAPLASRSVRLHEIFEQGSLRLFFGIRNPANFVISAYSEIARLEKSMPFQKYIERMDIDRFRWSATFEKLLKTTPDINLSVWKYEELHDISRRLICEMTGFSEPGKLEFETRPINTGLSLEGGELLREYLGNSPDITDDEMNNIMREYTENYPSSEMPRHHDVMTPERIQQITYGYDDDWYYIRRMEGLNTITTPDNLAG